MKKFIPFILLGCFLLTCKEDDPCEGKICLNGGTCVDGVCTDPCKGKICLNDGVCINGICMCSERYEGADCGDQVTPKKILITKIHVTKFPATKASGAGWDLTSGPDIKILIKSANGVIFDSPQIGEDALNTSIYEFTQSLPIEISPTIQYTIELFDYDTFGENEWMGGIIFTAYHNENKFPTELILAPANSAVNFKLFVSYTF